MANLKDIRSRIASVKNIRKITRAMEMISAAPAPSRAADRAAAPLRGRHPAHDHARLQAAENIPNLPILQEKEFERSASC